MFSDSGAYPVGMCFACKVEGEAFKYVHEEFGHKGGRLLIEEVDALQVPRARPRCTLYMYHVLHHYRYAATIMYAVRLYPPDERNWFRIYSTLCPYNH